MLAFLQLLRLPTVFTAMADIVLGFVLTHRFLYGPLAVDAAQVETRYGWNDPARFASLWLASCCLYLSGMVFNDVFDRKQDALERPGRPIPSGRVSLRAAIILGSVLMLVGVSSAATAGTVSLMVALFLVLSILGYDAVLKRTELGPIAMGLCRFLNVMLGASAQPDLVTAFTTQPQLAAAAGLGIYIAGVTIFARTEALTSNRWRLGMAQTVINLGFAILLGLIAVFPGGTPKEVPLAMLFVVAFTVNRRAIEALREPSPRRVQRGVKIMLLSLVVMDATLVFWYTNTPAAGGYGAIHAMATAALLIPALFLSRFIPMT